MNKRSLITAVAVSVIFGVLAPSLASAQFGSLSRRIKRAAGDQIGRELENTVRGAIHCAYNDIDCINKAESEGQTPVMTDANGNVLTDDNGQPITDPGQAAAKVGSPAAAAPNSPTEKPGTGAWVNYDFVPGDRVLVFDDFSADRVGDFPRRFELLAGNWEVAEWNGSRYIRATSPGTIAVELPETLPERFTVEFPASVQHGNAYIRLSTAAINHGDRAYAGSAVSFEYAQGGLRQIRGEGPRVLTRRRQDATKATLVTVRVMADGDYMKVYFDDQRVANAPNAVFPRTNKLYFTTTSVSDELPALIGTMRIAAGGLDLYDRLAADGRVSTQGILFAVNSDAIRPESTPTLREMSDMLAAHPELRISIEGHTDSDGDDGSNLDLSRRRAAAVKAVLVSTYGVDGSRLETAGFGESQPVADNGTAEGKQQNRRVELVKL